MSNLNPNEKRRTRDRGAWHDKALRRDHCGRPCRSNGGRRRNLRVPRPERERQDHVLRMLCGLLRADDGSGEVLGHNVIAGSEAIKREVGYMTQRFSFWEDLSIEENLDFVARMYGVKNRRKTVRESVQELGDRKSTRLNSSH